MQPASKKFTIILLVIAISFSLNLLTFFMALPYTQGYNSGCCSTSSDALARDFSAFYFGAWSLIHDPKAIYSNGSNVNASSLGILPHPETYKYLPSFLILMLPFLALNYEQALLAFDYVQIAMLIVIAFLIYEFLKEKNVIVCGAVLFISLVLPFSTEVKWGISEAYFWQWAEAQSKILILALILVALFFARIKQPILSGVIFGFSFFDPRFFLLGIPLFLTFNKGKLASASLATVGTALVTNLPIFAIPGVMPVFLQNFFSVGALSPVYPYSYIPIVSLVFLSIAEWKEIALAFSIPLPAKLV